MLKVFFYYFDYEQLTGCPYKIYPQFLDQHTKKQHNSGHLPLKQRQNLETFEFARA